MTTTKNNIESNNYGITFASAIYDKNASRFYSALWHWLKQGSFVMCLKNEDCARYICGPEYRRKVETACMKILGQTIELAAMGKGRMIYREQMSKLCGKAVADMRNQFLRRCQERKYQKKDLTVYEFDTLFVVAPAWWLLSTSEAPEIHVTNY